MALIKKILVAILTLESRLIIAKYRPFIVAVTGSVGKTSTKDAIYTVLKDHSRFVRKSEKSMNSEIGLPLTVIGVPNAWRNLTGWLKNIWRGARLVAVRGEYPDCLILEVGADHPGDIKKITAWLRPDIAVITKISDTPVHVEFFKSPEDVFEEKANLAAAVKPGGTLVLFGDDEKVKSMSERVAKAAKSEGVANEVKDVKIVTYGANAGATVKGSDYAVMYEGSEADRIPVGFSFNLEWNSRSEALAAKGIIGNVYQYPLLAAAAVGIAHAIPLDDIVRSLAGFDPPRGRMNILPGVNGSIIIDDTYNSSPDAAMSALQTLKDLACAGAKFAALGDMMELGKYSVEEHRRIGREAASVVSRLITVGPRSRGTADEAIRSGMSPESVQSFDASIEAAPV
ncbi:MAG: UDP-N-acetylmuramoyl-tripeptide--D-alanyl-D-alanine ligase, partial [Candidatus Parcubacteria bacterium]|nr:UDP-N-acetylmuramoyl-tripeptide--D-alanyl-D-alanine ligase [Candidatus Parcubacteria bacterium]